MPLYVEETEDGLRETYVPRKVNMNDKDIILDEKTKAMVSNIGNQMRMLQDKLDSILQTVVNTKYPDSTDTYELSKEGDKLTVVEN